MERSELEPKLVDLIAGLRAHQVKLAVQLLLDYIDDRTGHPQPATHPRIRVIKSIDGVIAFGWNETADRRATTDEVEAWLRSSQYPEEHIRAYLSRAQAKTAGMSAQHAATG